MVGLIGVANYVFSVDLCANIDCGGSDKGMCNITTGRCECKPGHKLQHERGRKCEGEVSDIS